MELLELLKIIGKYRAIIVVLTVSALINTVAFTYVIEERFESSALVLVRPQEEIQFAGAPADKETLNFPIPRVVPFEAMSKTFGEVIRSRTIAEEVVRRLELDTTSVETIWWKIWKQRVKGYLKDAWTYLKYGRIERSDPFTSATELVQKLITVEPTKDTYVFEIRFLARFPELAAAVVNTAADVFVEYNLNLYRSESSVARAFIEEQVRKSDASLARARMETRSYKERHGIVELDKEIENTVDSVAELRTDFEQIRRKVASTEARVAVLAGQLGMRKTKSRRIDGRLIAGSLREDLMSKLILAESELASLRAGSKRLAATIETREAALETLPERQAELARLRLDMAVAEDTHRLIRQAFDEARIREAEQIQEIRVIAAATVPTYPVRPIKVYYAGAAVALALVVGVVIALLLEYLNFALESSDDAQEALQLPLLATFPRIED